MLEQTLKYDKKAIDVLLPRLINSYLWLLDYYLYQVQAKENARVVVEKILQVIEKGVSQTMAREHLLERMKGIFSHMEKIFAR
jgi:hypothetical protein